MRRTQPLDEIVKQGLGYRRKREQRGTCVLSPIDSRGPGTLVDRVQAYQGPFDPLREPRGIEQGSARVHRKIHGDKDRQ